MMSNYFVEVTRCGSRMLIGAINCNALGYKFLPFTCAHQPSRKRWPTPEAAVPRWVGKYRLIERCGNTTLEG